MTTDADRPAAAEPRPASGRLSAPDEVWAAIRRDYLAGRSAPECCWRYGVGLTALRERARREGWRRVDQGWSPPNELDPEDEGVKLEYEIDGDLDRVEPRQIAYVAWRRMLRAAMRGEAAEALRWRRVHLVLDRVQSEVDRMIEQEESVRRYYHGSSTPPADPNGPNGPNGPDGPDGPDAVSTS